MFAACPIDSTQQATLNDICYGFYALSELADPHKFCGSKGGNLTLPKSAEENSFVQELAEGTG